MRFNTTLKSLLIAAMVMGGAARLCYHGIDRIRPGTSALLQGEGRINLTCRVVD